MKREVNLHQNQFLKAKLMLSALMILQLTATLLAGLVLIYGLGQWRVSIRSGRLESLGEQLVTERARIAQLAETHPPSAKDPDLDIEIQGLAAERDDDPTARATFGIFSGQRPVIFRREIY